MECIAWLVFEEWFVFEESTERAFEISNALVLDTIDARICRRVYILWLDTTYFF